MSTRKNKQGWKKFAFDGTPSSSKDKPLNCDIVEVPTLNTTPKNTFNFEREITPKIIEDLAVHSKKISDIEFWLQNNVIRRSPTKQSFMLLITGPTGCGKTITAKVLCKKLGIELMEWINPVDKAKDFLIGQTSQLLEFLSESKYPSLFCISKPKVTLIEDFPNSVIHNPSEFINILEKCFDTRTSVIFICTDSNSNLDLAHTLFPQDLRDRFSIYNINFNATSATLLKKALKRVECLMENHVDICNVPNQSDIDNVISSSMGDIRCAVNQLYFSCLKDATAAINSSPIKSGIKRKRNTKNTTKIENMMKTERLSFFHGLGRVLNPKRLNTKDSWRLHCDVDALVEELGIQPSTFNSFIHANYLKYFGDVNDIANAAEILSLSQDYLSKWDFRKDLLKYGLWMTVMGLMVYNEHRVSKWTQICAPKKIVKTKDNNVDMRYLNSIDKSYYNIINKNEKNVKI